MILSNNKQKLSLSLFFFIACILSGTVVKGQSHTQKNAGASLVKWMHFEEAVERSKTEKRKLFIDVYTDWCGWCKVMDKKTFSNPEVAKLLNEEFYPVKLDAEQSQDIVFMGNTYKFVPQGRKGYHQLAAALLNYQMSYPTVVFMDEDFSGTYPIQGYRSATDFYPFLVFFSENHHKKGNNAWEEFQKNYQSPF